MVAIYSLTITASTIIIVAFDSTLNGIKLLKYPLFKTSNINQIMKAYFDTKHDFARITPQNQADLTLLSLLLTKGALVKTKTLRSVTIRRGAEEKFKAGKREMLLKILVEKIELNEALRIGGEIQEGPEEVELHAWHTLEIKQNQMLEVWRAWKKWETKQIKEAAKPPEPVLLCILDERDADFWVVRERPQHVAHIAGPGLGKKEIAKKPEEYYADSVKVLQRKPDINHIVLAGPGFTRENLQKFIKERFRELLPKVRSERLNEINGPGLHEFLKSGMLEKIVKESKLGKEVASVEKVLSELGKKGLAAYGKDVENAVESRAVQKIIVADEKVREFENVLDEAEKAGAEILIVSTGHDAGQKLLGLGGIAAELKFKI